MLIFLLTYSPWYYSNYTVLILGITRSISAGQVFIADDGGRRIEINAGNPLSVFGKKKLDGLESLDCAILARVPSFMLAIPMLIWYFLTV